MPYQLNGQLVTIKSQRLPHAAGALAAAGGGAFVTMISPDDTSAACAAPASPRITAASTPILFIDSGAGARHEPGQQRWGVMTRVLCPFMAVPPKLPAFASQPAATTRPQQWTDDPFSLETGSPRSTNEINAFRKLIPCLLHREELGRRQARACNRLAADPAECQARSGVEFITPPPLQ